MSSFSERIAGYVLEEIRLAKIAEQSGDTTTSFTHLENAHVLGQESTYWHVRVHWLMLLWGLRQRDIREAFGQIIRIVGAAALTAVKGVPVGNTGGSNVSPVKPMPISPEHQEILNRVRSLQSSSD